MQKWKKILFFNIVELNERFKYHFSKDVLAYFHNRFSVIFRQLNIFSIFEHMLDCSRNCHSLIGCQICSFVEFTKTDNHKLFEDIIVDKRDLSKEFLEVLRESLCFLYLWLNCMGTGLTQMFIKYTVAFALLIFRNQANIYLFFKCPY